MPVALQNYQIGRDSSLYICEASEADITAAKTDISSLTEPTESAIVKTTAEFKIDDSKDEVEIPDKYNETIPGKRTVKPSLTVYDRVGDALLTLIEDAYDNGTILKIKTVNTDTGRGAMGLFMVSEVGQDWGNENAISRSVTFAGCPNNLKRIRPVTGG